MRLRTIYLIFSVIALVVGFSVHYYEKGRNGARLACVESRASAAQAQLGQFVSDSQQLAFSAYSTSRELSKRIADRTTANQESTKEIRYVLKTSADARCHYSADLMRQLNDARDRANQAATSGFSDALPAVGSAGKQQ